MEKIRLDRPIIVEGKYDKIKLSSIIDSEIITTNGFSFFKDKQKKDYIKSIALKKGIIVLTDSDNAGLLIRNRLKDFIPNENITNLYIPSIKGKEKRKEKPSSEGTLGVEGIDVNTLKNILNQYISDKKTEMITEVDLYNFGLCGKENSAYLREKICNVLGLPINLKAKGFLDAVNMLSDKDELISIIKSADKEQNENS